MAFWAHLGGFVAGLVVALFLGAVRPEPERGGGTAKFRLNALSEAAQEAGDKFVTVETGEKFAGRFRLIQVGRSEAVVEDLLRNRRIAYYVSGNYAPAE